MSSYKQLTQHQRYQIYALLKSGHNQREIADTIEVDNSTNQSRTKTEPGPTGLSPKTGPKESAEQAEVGAEANQL